jgi:hypothetical protein
MIDFREGQKYRALLLRKVFSPSCAGKVESVRPESGAAFVLATPETSASVRSVADVPYVNIPSELPVPKNGTVPNVAPTLPRFYNIP